MFYSLLLGFWWDSKHIQDLEIGGNKDGNTEEETRDEKL